MTQSHIPIDDHALAQNGIKNRLTAIFLTFLALVLNVALAYAASKLHLTLFLDTVFTVAITFYLGLVAGLVVAMAHNPIMTLIYCYENGTKIFYYDFLYLLCGILIVIVTWIFSRNKKEFLFSRTVTILYLFVIALGSAFVSCFTASALDTFIRPLFGLPSPFGPINIFTGVFQNFNFGIFLSNLLPRIPITVLDRLVCTFAGYGVYRLLSITKTPPR